MCIFEECFPSPPVAVRPRLKAIYLWESASASQEAKTRKVFTFGRIFFEFVEMDAWET